MQSASQGPVRTDDAVTTEPQLFEASMAEAGPASIAQLLAPGTTDHGMPVSDLPDPFSDVPALLGTTGQSAHQQTEAHTAAASQPQDNGSLLDAVMPDDTHATTPSIGIGWPEYGTADAQHPSGSQLEQPADKQASTEPSSSPVALGQKLIEAHAKLSHTPGVPQSGDSMPGMSGSQPSTQGSLLGEADGLSVDDDDFADNVELPSVGMDVSSSHQHAQMAVDTNDSLLQMAAQSMDEAAVNRQDQQHKQQQPHGDNSVQSVQQLLASPAAAAQETSLAENQTSSFLLPSSPVQTSDESESKAKAGQSKMSGIDSNSPELDLERKRQPQQQLQFVDVDQQDKQGEPETAVLQPHEIAMAKAEEAERRLLTGEQLAFVIGWCTQLPLDSLAEAATHVVSFENLQIE